MADNFLFITSQFLKISEVVAGEIAQLVKGLLCKHEEEFRSPAIIYVRYHDTYMHASSIGDLETDSKSQ